jgi:hypothetical protein
MKLSFPILTFFIVFILSFGLINTIKESLEVAPFIKEGADEGRLFAHMKNATRLVHENAAELHNYLQTAVPYPEAKTTVTAPSADNWQQFFLQSQKLHSQPRHVIIVPGGDIKELKWAAPALFYAYFHGSPVLFFAEGELSGNVEYKNLKAFIIGPEDLIPKEVENQFEQVKRITARSPQHLAIKLAKYRNEETEFGWGRVAGRENGYFHFIVTIPDDALHGLAALPFARSNNATLLYAENDGGISGALDNYAFSQRSDWFVTPSEGPFRHFWIVSNRISYAAQARLDFAVEKAEYASMGPVALGDTEALLLILILWGIASALFVWIHSLYTLPMVTMPVKIGWVLGSLLLPLLGPVLYINAYRRPAIKKKKGDMRWIRTHNQQSAAATIMSFGYGATMMIAVGFLFVWFGFPLVFSEWIEGPFFWLGAGMTIMMISMYIIPVLLAWRLVQYPMKKMMMPGMPDKKISKMAFITAALSMLAVSLGMMTSAWLLLMRKFPMMPAEDDVLWFGSMWLASFIGFLVAWPLNWILIRKHLKPGNV